MPGEATPPLTKSHAPSTPREGVDGVSTTMTTPPDRAAQPRPSADRRRRLFALLAAVAVLAYATDQISKLVALDVLGDGEPRPFIGDAIRFKLIGNPGAALSLGAGNTWVMTAIALGVLVAIIYVARDLGSRAWALALGLLLGAAVGNLTDRFVRPPGGGQGHVVDFIDYNRWFIGNVADIWIVSAAGLIVVLALLGIGIDGRRDSRARPDDADLDPAGDDATVPRMPRPTEPGPSASNGHGDQGGSDDRRVGGPDA